MTHDKTVISRASALAPGATPRSATSTVVGQSQQVRLMSPTGSRPPARAWLVVLALVGLGSSSAGATDAKRIFNQRCTACHTFGHGVKVGPDLKGVTTRRTRPWLIRFVRASQTVIKSGDPTANQLFTTFKGQRMPDWTDLSPADVESIMDWFAVNGPEQKEPDERDAALATAADLARARALFDGLAPLANGGLACARCHQLADGERRGGTLGPDLTGAYLKYRDRALTLYLKRPCTPRQPEASATRYLTPEESFALKGYLRQAGLTVVLPVSAPTKGAP